MSAPPTGTVTFLFTDIEGSTKLAQQHPANWEPARLRHHAIVRAAVETNRGHVFQIIGDAFCAAFPTAPDALAAALAAQHALHAEAWAETPIRVRMGLHTGEVEAQNGEYQGYMTLAQAQRVMAVAYGGQVLVSDATAALIRRRLPNAVMLRDLGEQRLKGLLSLERLWQVVTPDLRADFPPLQSLNATPNNLPVQLTSFVGRDTEIAEVKHLLAATRLLTLTGSGGTGKTRLSLQVAAEVLDQYPDGVWFVELAPLADPALVAQTVAAALGAREEPGRSILATLTEHLHGKHLLLILDNCEHLIEACARFADAVLHESPELRVLASSREALGIAGEHAYRVPSLAVPSSGLPLAALSQIASVQLFNERAQAAKNSFSLTSANAPAVAQICQRLDGIPLAIELAAARVKALSAEQIAMRLDDRFRLLTGGSRTALPRQQTLRALIDWSYGLLSDPERVLLRRLSVFAGGWTLEAAEDVTNDDARQSPAKGLGGGLKDESISPSAFILDPSDILDLLTRLVEKSLVVADEQSGETRYRLLETIRQYAREKLLASDDGEAVRTRHLQYFLRFAESAEQKQFTAGEGRWLDALEVEHDNMRTAIDWSSETGMLEPGMRLASALNNFWITRGHTGEGRARLAGLLKDPRGARPTITRAKTLNAAGYLARCEHDYVAACALLEEGLALSRQLKDIWNVTWSLQELAGTLIVLGELSRARVLLEESLELQEQAGNRQGIADSLHFLGEIALVRGEYDQAERLIAESAKHLQILDAKGGLGLSLRRRAHVALYQGDPVRAAELATESLNLVLEVGWERPFGAIAVIAETAAVRGQPILAVRLFAAVDTLLTSLHHKLLPFDQREYDRALSALRLQLDPGTFNAAWEAGRALTLEQAVALVLEEPDT